MHIKKRQSGPGIERFGINRREKSILTPRETVFYRKHRGCCKMNCKVQDAAASVICLRLKARTITFVQSSTAIGGSKFVIVSL